MKTVSPALLAFLNASRVRDFPVVMADCFTFSFVNGGVAYFTNYDVSITWDGHLFLAEAVLVQGLKFKVSTGLEVDRQQITLLPPAGGTINGSPWLNAIRDGAFDGAQVQRDRVFIDDALPGGIDGLTLFKGRVSTIDKVGRTSAQLTVASPLVVLDYYMPRNIFSPTCLHVLYDAGCGISATSFQLISTVGAASTQTLINNTSATQDYVQGSMLFTSGLNEGLRATVKSAVNGASFTLMYPLPNAPAPGDGFVVYFGCDHTLATCTGKFANAINFRGFPQRSSAGLCDLIRELDEEAQRAAVLAEARSWIKTPYHHGAGVKGAGVDCAQLLVRTYVDCGLIEPFETGSYCQDWHMHRNGELYLDFVLRFAHRVEQPKPGDVILLRYGRAYAHGGIVTRVDPLTVLHAWMAHRIVVEEEIGRCPAHARRLREAIFASFWG